MHGLGNDFMVVNCLSEDCPDFRDKVTLWSDRRFGIGFDQLLIVRPSQKADFKMEILNADGGEVEMCGNGIRCVAQYLVTKGLTSKKELTIETLGGMIKPRLLDNLVEVDMGEPELNAAKIPTTLEGKIIDCPVEIAGREFAITCVNMGNPHCVIFVDKVDDFPVNEVGPKFERHEIFPNRINTEFIQVIDPAHLKMRVWERGAGETLACGTGACGALVAAVLTGRAQREATLHLKGGDLKIHWSQLDNHVYMTGPGKEIYSGTIQV